jgi:hypothetical protein
MYKTLIELNVTPTKCLSYPYLRIGLDNNIWYDGTLSETKSFINDVNLEIGEHSFYIKLLYKKNENSNPNEDQAVIINYLKFENISADRFIWSGVYTPEYPEPWATEQKENNIELPTNLTNINYIGWNGIWKLKFDVPIFTWIHQTENLGWIFN